MKVIEEIMREVDLEIMRRSPHAQRKYNKITESLRNRFLSKIYQENKSIKKAAEELNINYSSAKTILTLHRKKSTTPPLLSAEDISNAISQKDKEHSHDSDFASTAASLVRMLPPKHLIRQSFLSTASNLSEAKDHEDSNEEPHFSRPIKQAAHSFSYSKDNLAHLNSPLKQQTPILPGRTQSFPTLPMMSSAFSQPKLSSSHSFVEKSSSIHTTNNINNINNMNNNNNTNQNTNNSDSQILLQLSQQMHAQQQQQQQKQQQQLQNTLNQLIIIQNVLLAQNAAAASTTNQTPSSINSQNPLQNLLFQQQLLALSSSAQNQSPLLNPTTVNPTASTSATAATSIPSLILQPQSPNQLLQQQPSIVLPKWI